MRRADITLKYSNDKDVFVVDLDEDEEQELIKLRDDEEPRILKNTEDLYWFLVHHKLGTMVEERHGEPREAEYIDALIRFYDGKEYVHEEYDIYC
jgi:hypothetical protein